MKKLKFQIEFSGNNLQKFKSFISTCYKIFTKSGIVMTVEEDKSIKVVADPFNISEKFLAEFCTTKALDIYKNLIFVGYPLIPSSNNSQNNSTYDHLKLKVGTKDNNNLDPEFVKNVSFRISKEELKKLNELFETTFHASNQIIIMATNIPEFMTQENANNYKNSFLSIYDKSLIKAKSGILFKPLKNYYKISDYEEEIYNGENVILGQFLYNNQIKTKLTKKICEYAGKNFNKKITMYVYNENDLQGKNVKSYLIISYLNNFINYDKYFPKGEDEENDDFENIYKIEIKSDSLIKILRYFNGDVDNPDYISVWSKGLVVKTNFKSKNNFEEQANNEGNNISENHGQNSFNANNQGGDLSYMYIKAFYMYEKNMEIIKFEGIDLNDGMAKKKFITDLLENSVDEKHDELNNSLDLSYDQSGIVYRADGSLIEEDEEEENNNNDENFEEDKKILKKKKKINMEEENIDEEDDDDDE